ncbi:hypothetical protein [Mycoplasma capricolum]|uniref:hypothetical protein n=1 Tax=Mycoplasma capricolum TaxID=2095 RepID=UPI003DA33242
MLTILSSLGLIATSSLFVISCKNNISRSEKENTNSDQKREKSKRPATEEEKINCKQFLNSKKMALQHFTPIKMF